MPLTYSHTHTFSPSALQDLFLSVEWSSGHYPEKLAVAMMNFKTVVSAWDGDKLVGMICAMDDGIMNAYIHYLLVRPEYQGKGIGKTLVQMVREKYKDYLRIVVVAYNKENPLLRALRIREKRRRKPDVYNGIVNVKL